MHRFDRKSKRLSWKILSYALQRIRRDYPLDRGRTPDELRQATGATITPAGIGGKKALQLWRDVLAPACITVDHPRFMAYVPSAPTEAAGLFDVAVSAANVYAGSWQEGSGAVFAENEALRWLADVAGFSITAGGVFVSGGTAGNLSALIAARWNWRHHANGVFDNVRGAIVASRGAHSSISQSARAMDVDVMWVDTDTRGRMTGVATQSAIDAMSEHDKSRVFAIVATGGTTNIGVVDDLTGVGECARNLNTWFHVDAAYGGAGLIAPTVRHLFNGIEHADSFIVDPHKWLFAPFDCCALLYANPQIARAAHTQHAEYLDALHQDDEWNPSDYAHHLSRRARGLPFWFSLATYGTNEYQRSVEVTLDITRAAARQISEHPDLELAMDPELSIVMFRRVGWSVDQYYAWSDKVLNDGVAFVTPTTWHNEVMLRLCIVNPLTSAQDIAIVLGTLK